MERISVAHIERQISQINDLLMLSKEESYELEYAYCGVKVFKNGGSVSMVSVGFGTKRQVFEGLQYFIAGVVAAQNNFKKVV